MLNCLYPKVKNKPMIQKTQNEVYKYTQLETLTDEQIYNKGVSLVTDRILPFVRDVQLVDDGMAGVVLAGMPLSRVWEGEKSLYSRQKDTICNVKILLSENPDAALEIDEHHEDFAKSLSTLSLDAMAGSKLTVIARFYDGKTVGVDAKGTLELTLDPSKDSTILSTQLGDSPAGVDIGTIDTMAVWLRDVEAL